MTSEPKIYNHWDGRSVVLNRVILKPEFAGVKYNLYTCYQGHYNLSLDLDRGTTPMFVICRRPAFDRDGECGETAASSVYRVEDVGNYLPVVLIFRRPTAKEVVAATPAQREHYELGGLAMEWVLRSREDI